MKEDLTLVAISDTHMRHREVEVPDGDVLVFAGDFMTCGRKFSEVQSFASWFSNRPHKYKIMIAGNHDFFMEHSLNTCLAQFANNVIYLQDSGCEIKGWKFWGSPYQPGFCNWAFNVPRGEAIKRHWDLIPDDTDVLVTHGPPQYFCDSMGSLYEGGTWTDAHVGCEELTLAVGRVKPKIHIFGHIHNGYGTDKTKYTEFHNVSICNEAYVPTNAPHVIQLKGE
jgi:Icc-related predicted phosphoesterase